MQSLSSVSCTNSINGVNPNELQSSRRSLSVSRNGVIYEKAKSRRVRHRNALMEAAMTTASMQPVALKRSSSCGIIGSTSLNNSNSNKKQKKIWSEYDGNLDAKYQQIALKRMENIQLQKKASSSSSSLAARIPSAKNSIRTTTIGKNKIKRKSRSVVVAKEKPKYASMIEKSWRNYSNYKSVVNPTTGTSIEQENSRGLTERRTIAIVRKPNTLSTSTIGKRKITTKKPSSVKSFRKKKNTIIEKRSSTSSKGIQNIKLKNKSSEKETTTRVSDSNVRNKTTSGYLYQNIDTASRAQSKLSKIDANILQPSLMQQHQVEYRKKQKNNPSSVEKKSYKNGSNRNY